MANGRRSPIWDHPVPLTFLIFAVIAFLYFSGEVLKPLALSVLLSFALAPIVSRFRKLGMPRPAAVMLTVVVTVGGLGAMSYVVWNQLSQLADELPEHKETIEAKLSVFQADGSSTATRLTQMIESITRNLQARPVPVDDKSQEGGKSTLPATAPNAERLQTVQPIPVEVISHPSIQDHLKETLGPVLEPLTVASFVLILVLFMLIGQEDLRDRMIALFGRASISLTTKTLDEVGRRIGRYLGMFATVNFIFGTVIGLGLWAIGLQFALLWGFIAAVLRFIPYVGAAIAFLLPVTFSIAQFDSWTGPLMVIGLFAVVETVANSFLEPIVYGKTTGISALGLLVAAMFWTWLWGPIGLVLSTPLTVCLAVLGKYIPALGIFATLLSEETHLDPRIRFYQRLLSLDEDTAIETVETALKEKPRAAVFDEILIPALTHAEADLAEGDIDGREQAFVWRVTRDLIDDLNPTPALVPEGDDNQLANGPLRVATVPVNDEGDELPIRMLQTLIPEGLCTFEMLGRSETPMRLAQAIRELDPDLVVISHLPPMGLTPVKYLVKRLRAQLTDVPIVVGYWGDAGNKDAKTKFDITGQTSLVGSLAEASDKILAAAKAQAKPTEPTALASV